MKYPRKLIIPFLITLVIMTYISLAIFSPSKIVAIHSKCLIMMGKYDTAANEIIDYYEDSKQLDPMLFSMLMHLKMDVSEEKLHTMDIILGCEK